MKKQCASFIVALLLSAQLLSVNGQQTAGKSRFRAAEIVSAGEIGYPAGAAAWGTLVFEVWVTAGGAVEDVEVRRALEPFTDPSVRAIKSWEFRPATLGGKAVASSVMVAATFNPRVDFPANVPLPPLLPEKKREPPKSAFTPADVSEAVFPVYPVGAVSPGTVALECALNEKGEVESTKVIHDFVPYTPKAVEAIARWKFTPAKLNGKPVSSRIVLAFVFPTLALPPPRNDH
ncbi:MAG: energy transducer TonB [Deltaproteobacteria bacterium]